MRGSKRAAYPYVVWMAIFIIVPLLLVLIFAFTSQDGSFTLQNFADMVSDFDIFYRSLALALVSTAICLLIGYPLSYFLAQLNSKVQATMLMLIILPMWMNFLLRTYAWKTLLEDTGLINHFLSLFGVGPLGMINTRGAVILGMVYNYIPFMILPIYTVLTKMSKVLIEAAQDLGATPAVVFLKVILPLSFPGIVSGVTMVFVPAVSTFVISKLLGGGTYIMLGDLIDMQFLGNSYNPNLGAAISLVMMVMIIISMSIMSRYDDEEGGSMIL